MLRPNLLRLPIPLGISAYLGPRPSYYGKLILYKRQLVTMAGPIKTEYSTVISALTDLSS